MLKISQSQITEYERCQRLYYLKHIRKLAWPYIAKTSDVTDKGSKFHKLVNDLYMGIPADMLCRSIDDAVVSDWFYAFCKNNPLQGYKNIATETERSFVSFGIIWFGKFDAAAEKNGKLEIFDWKTSKKKRSAAEYLSSPQTRLYRLIAKESSKKLLPEDISMTYWFPQYPEEPIRLSYSTEAYESDLKWLKEKSAGMTAEEEYCYSKQENAKICSSCAYSTYCHSAGFCGTPVSEEYDEQEEDIEDEMFDMRIMMADFGLADIMF
ncbi:MAG: PD-(D/E)XK nuclease family protein [Anaerolineaceae bacterium]|nr:PD-(D/E)XK nuclease family protein [Anaerolineaceae bacterium]